ncbi:hypothetical protein QBC35DRAFT_187481 [Podospora australis]|uniref:Secreted protein n=1 Tax=Podospora australis TaxID=1536484 RepID=A0AAN6WW92_9PEZI|nr:hypothetical protein QBC35DRAFT_187481 [Podospora australis]
MRWLVCMFLCFLFWVVVLQKKITSVGRLHLRCSIKGTQLWLSTEFKLFWDKQACFMMMVYCFPSWLREKRV